MGDRERRSKDREKISRSNSRRSESSEKRPKRRSGSRGRRSNSKDKDRRSKSRERDRNTRNPKSRRNSGNKDSNSKEQKVKNSNHEPLGIKDSNSSNLRQVNFVRKPFEANPDLEKRKDLEFELMGKRQEALINFVRKPFEKEQDESSAAIARPSLLPEPVRSTNFFMSSLVSNSRPSHPTNFALYSPIRTPNFAPGPSSSSLNCSPFTTNSSPSAIRPFSPAQHPRPFSPSQNPRPFSSLEPFAKN